MNIDIVDLQKAIRASERLKAEGFSVIFSPNIPLSNEKTSRSSIRFIHRIQVNNADAGRASSILVEEGLIG